jgi:WD40 repeat protein
LTYDPASSRLSSGGIWNEITIWDAAGNRVSSLTSSGSCLCFSPDGRLLAVGGGLKGTIQVWDVDERKLVNNLLVGRGPATVAFLSNKEVLCQSDDKLMRRKIDDSSAPVASQHLPNSDDIAIAVSSTGDFLVAGYGRYEADPGEGAIACWDLRRGMHRLLPGHDGSSVFDVAIDPTGKLIVAAGGPRFGPGFVKLWNARTRELRAALPKEEIGVTGVAFSPAADRLAVVASGDVAVWGSLTGQPELVWRRDAGRAFRVAIAPRGDVLAVGCFVGDETIKDSRSITVWDIETKELETVSFDRAIMDMAFSPDGRLLASIDWNGSVEVYDRRQQRTVLRELAHQRVGNSVTFSPDGHTLATASSSGEIKFWHVPTMMYITTLRTRDGVAELTFFPNGRTLAVGYTDRVVELWHVDWEKQLLNIDGDVNPQESTAEVHDSGQGEEN